MFRLAALWAVGMAAAIFLIILREEWLAAQGKIPLGRLRRFWVGSDRRRAPRYRVDWPIRYQRLPPGGMNGAKSRDLSMTGVALVVPERFEIGSVIQIELILPGQPQPWAVTGQVRWTREISSPGERLFALGVQFQGLDPEREKLLFAAIGQKRG